MEEFHGLADIFQTHGFQAVRHPHRALNTGLTNNVPVAWEAVPLDVISAHLAARLARS